MKSRFIFQIVKFILIWEIIFISLIIRKLISILTLLILWTYRVRLLFLLRLLMYMNQWIRVTLDSITVYTFRDSLLLRLQEWRPRQKCIISSFHRRWTHYLIRHSHCNSLILDLLHLITSRLNLLLTLLI